MKLPTVSDLFDTSHSIAGTLIDETEPPYLIISKIKDYIKLLLPTLGSEYKEYSPGVFVGGGVKIAPCTELEGPCIISEGAVIRHGAYIRANVIIGRGAVIGNSTEIKNSIIFDEAQIPHFNYVGDSVLGYKSHFGAGVIASNFKLDHSNISIITESKKIGTGLRKLGSLIGDFSEVGCNTVLYPGTIIGKKSLIYPQSSVRGIIPENHILKSDGRLIMRV